MSAGWLRVHVGIDRNAKVLALPNDNARWAWLVTLTEGKQQSPEGAWVSEEHLRACLGRRARYAPAFFAVGLLDRLDDGRVAVHDWSEWQSDFRSDPTAAERQRRKRALDGAREREEGALSRDSQRDGSVTTDRHTDTQACSRKRERGGSAAGLPRTDPRRTARSELSCLRSPARFGAEAVNEPKTWQGDRTWILDEAIDSEAADWHVEVFWPLRAKRVWVRTAERGNDDEPTYVAVSVDEFLRVADELRALRQVSPRAETQQ